MPRLDCCARMQLIPVCISPPTFKLVGRKVTGTWVALKTAPASIGARMITCRECGKPSMYQLSNGAVICLECMDRFQLEQNTARINFLLGEVESINGAAVGSIGSRIEFTEVVQLQLITCKDISRDKWLTI